jgi:PAS domain S-box-containing protein
MSSTHMHPHTRPRLSFRLPLEPMRLLRARERIRDYLHGQRVDGQTIDDMVLAIEEAMTNAVRHSRTQRDLEVELRPSSADIHVRVRDHGEGFDVESIDRESMPDPLSLGGRGLFLMGRLMDGLELRCNGGLEVRLFKRDVLPADAEPAGGGHAAAAALDGSEAYRDGRQRSFLEEMSETFMTLDWEHHVTYANAAALKFFGFSLEDVLGKSFWEIFPATRTMPVGETVRRAMDLGASGIEEYISPAVGRWVECRVYPTMSGVSLYLREIDERKCKELERDELQAMLKRSQELAHLGSWELDLVTGTLSWSDEVFRIFGLEPQEFGATYEAFLERVHPDDRQAVDEAYSGSLRADRDWYEIEHRVVRKHSGDVRNVLERCEHLRDGSGKIVRSVGMVHDITALKRKEAEREELLAALRESDVRYRTMADGMPFPIWVTDADGGNVFVNHAYEEFFGLGLEAVAGPNWQPLVHPGDCDRYLAEFQAASGERRPFHAEVRLKAADGEWHWVESFASPRYSTGSEFLGMVGCSPDISHRKRTEASRALQTEVLQVLNGVGGLRELVGDALRTIQRATGFEAVGLRLHQGSDYPYFEQNGFTPEFIEQESFLCALDARGGVVRDALGRALLQCTCGLVVSGRTEPTMSCFTAAGSFWTNRSSDLLALTPEEDPRVEPRNRCIHVGYPSVGLFPLRSGQETIGLLQLNDRREGRFTPELIESYESLAQNMGLALKRALAEQALRESEARHRTLFETLQEGLMHPLPAVEGLELALRSLPARSPELIGGDFCDVFGLPEEKVLAVIGDVAGKGMRAAALAETVRSALRSFALVDDEPGFILRKANELLLADGSIESFVTALAIVLDKGTGEARIASAGHPGPMRVGHGVCGLVEPLYGPPLGSFAADYATSTVLLDRGQSLVLYTDGVIEARSEGVLFGEEHALGTVCVMADQPAQDIADALASAARSFSRELEDDLEVLVLRWT